MNIDEIYNPVQNEIKQVEGLLSQEMTNYNHPFAQALAQHTLLLQGKRIRPILLLHVANVCGGIKDIHIKLSVIVELLHNATLLHDDVLDEAIIRRHSETLNKRYSNDASVLFGDLLLSRILFLSTQLNSKEINEILALTAQNICIGELSQIFHKLNFDMKEKEYIEIIKLKTASLFSSICRLGFIGSSVNSDVKSHLEKYGLNIGTAFQIIDDCLDIIGDETVIGKSLGTDLDKGRLTMPLLKLLQELPINEKDKLQKLLFSSDNSSYKKDKIFHLMREYNIISYSYKRAKDFIDEAKSELEIVKDNQYVKYLYQLADFVVNRKN